MFNLDYKAEAIGEVLDPITTKRAEFIAALTELSESQDLRKLMEQGNIVLKRGFLEPMHIKIGPGSVSIFRNRVDLSDRSHKPLSASEFVDGIITRTGMRAEERLDEASKRITNAINAYAEEVLEEVSKMKAD